MERRRLLALLTLGTVALVAGCDENGMPRASSTAGLPPDLGGSAGPTLAPPAPSTSALAPSAPVTTAPPLPPSAPALPGIPPARPGPTTLHYSGPSLGRQFALTVDDGYDKETVAGYVDFAQRTGIPITFSPNGAYQAVWKPHAPTLRPLVEAGQVQIGNHTFTHKDMTRRTDAQIAADLEKNEDWIERTFGTTSRPYLRPPFGARDARTDAVAGSLGFTSILMWNGTLGDSGVISPATLMTLARRYLRPGAVVLGHANHPTVVGLLDQLEALIADRHLRAVTLDTMFGTSRALG